MSKTFFGLSIKISLVLINVFLAGCTPYIQNVKPTTHDNYIAQYKRISQVIISNKTINESGIGAGTGLLAGAGTCFIVPPVDPLITPLIIVTCLPIGATVGAVAGAYESNKIDRLKKEFGTIQDGLIKYDLPKRMYQISEDYARQNNIDLLVLGKDINDTESSNNTEQRLDVIVEFDLEKIEISHHGQTNVIISIKSKLLRSNDNAVLDSFDENVVLPDHSFEDLVVNNYTLLDKELDTYLSNTIHKIMDKYFLIYYPVLAEEKSYTDKTQEDHTEDLPKRYAPYYVLEPKYPSLVFSASEILGGLFTHPKRFLYAARFGNKPFSFIKEVQPLLQWESFPWAYDQTKHSKFSDVTYDLQIYRFMDGALVYSKTGLKENQHLVEIQLDKETQYLWTVRARFKLSGRNQVTEWGGLYRSNMPSWTLKEASSTWNIDKFDILNTKKFYFYPFMIIEE